MSIVDRLRQNDPERTSIDINLCLETSDADLAQALEQNPFITAITVLVGRQTTNWGALLYVIETRANLEDVTLMNASDRNAPASFDSALLRAVQQNAAVRSVHFNCYRFPNDLSAFVDTATSITSLSFWNSNSSLEPFEREQGARDLAAAIQRNTNITTLKLGFMGDIYYIPILQSLQSNTYLKTLVFEAWTLTVAVSCALQQLFESNTSIEKFELTYPRFGGEHLSSVTQAIIGSNCVSKLKFSHCRFLNEEATAQFRSILQNKQNLTGLCLNRCDFSGGSSQVHETIISTLSRLDSSLRSFEWQEPIVGNTPPNGQFQNLLRAVEKSKLERFAIGNIQSQQQLQALTASIPLMRIKELEVLVEGVLGENENGKQDLLLAVKNNFSLRSVKCNRYLNGSSDIFNEVDKMRLVSYADRNKRLDQWVDNPEKVDDDRKVWPEALKLAEQAGPDSLFRGLRSVLGGDYVSLPAGRKRKRPQFSVPS